jgi:hypothetical protein
MTIKGTFEFSEYDTPAETGVIQSGPPSGGASSGGGGSGASLTNITAAALAALTAGTVSATTLYRVTDGAYRDTVYIYDATSDTLHPVGIPPSAYGYA